MHCLLSLFLGLLNVHISIESLVKDLCYILSSLFIYLIKFPCSSLEQYTTCVVQYRLILEMHSSSHAVPLFHGYVIANVCVRPVLRIL